jgi:ArsR family transcriptional regulator
MPHIPSLKAGFFKTLAHPVRIRVLELLGSGERSVTELQRALEIEQSNLSQQLGVLRNAGFVSARRDGSSVFYSVTDERISDVLVIARQVLIDAAAQTHEQLESS